MSGQFVSYYNVGHRIKVHVVVFYSLVFFFFFLVNETDTKVNAPKNSNVQNHLEMGDFGWFCSQASVNEMFSIYTSI